MNKIVFVSNVNPMNESATSTDIMTYNILYGFHQVGVRVHFVAITNYCDEQSVESIKSYYSSITSKLDVIPNTIGKNKGKYQYLMNIIRKYGDKSQYDSYLDVIDLEDKDVIISHAPSVVSIYYCRALKLKNSKIRYVQYWSDPFTLAGITLSSYSYKRFLHRWIEKKLLEYADKVIYGTEPLMSIQKKLFAEYAKKMSYVDVSYKALHRNENVSPKYDSARFLYAGNYYQQIRDISKLFMAVHELDGQVNLDVYGMGDVDNLKDSRIVIHDRISPEEMGVIERKYVNEIVILNKNCAQIPGKVFYNINLERNILVLVDGPMKEEITEYLKKYERFYLVNNEIEDIKKALIDLSMCSYERQKGSFDYSPEAIANQFIDGISKW